jgi:hypothetical protein
MFTFKLPGDQGDLLLLPAGAGLSPVLRVLLLGALVVVPVVLVVWLYRYELRFVPRAAAVSLLFLRLAGLSLLLVLLCLEPIYAHTHTEWLSGRVVVAVDLSDSMSVADPQRTLAEKLRLARALKLAADLCSEDQLEAWAAAYDQKKAPQWVKDDEAAGDPARRKELEKQRRQAHDQVRARVDALTRSQVARRVLGDEGAGLLSAMAAAGHKVELIGFHRDTLDAPTGRVEELFSAGPVPAGGEAASSFTDLRLPLAKSLATSGLGPNQVLGVVLLTDGLHNTGESPSEFARKMRDRVPVFPIGLGAHTPPPDAALVSVTTSQPTVTKNVMAPFDVQFTINSMPEGDFVVELHQEGKAKKPLGRRVLHHAGKDRAYTETFPVVMDEVGTQLLTASVRPTDPKAHEARTDNNSRSTTVNVSDDQMKVLLIDGEARWEYHYLATALKRDSTLRVKNVVFQQPRLDDGLTPEELDQIGSPRQSLPGGPDALSEYDCIILGDVSPEQLPPAERARLEKYVSERGGTLVLVAGKRWMPLGFPEFEFNGQADPLRKLLPIEAPRAVAPRDGFPISLTAAGRDTRFMEMDPDPTKSEATWSGLQRNYWAVVGQVKPGATGLAWLANEDDRPASERERQNSLIAWHHYGFGRVLFVGLDSTWRWRFKVGDLYHHTFWGAAVRWAAADKPLMSGNAFLRFGTPQPVYGRDDEVKVVVRFNEELGPVKADLLAGARLLAQAAPNEKEKPVALVPLAGRPGQPRVLEGKVSGLPPGSYAVELVIPELGDKLRETPAKADAEPRKPLRAFFTVRTPDSPELIELQTRWPLLEEIAAGSGGKVFTPQNASELLNLLASRKIPEVKREDQRLWQWWVPLAAVLTLLTLEWVGRKLAGLP